MQAAQRPLVPRLPGTSASKASKGMMILYAAFMLLGFIPLALLDAGLSGEQGGHLPWPVVQWAVTTPLGALALMALSFFVVGPTFVLRSISQRRRDLGRAVDVTGLPQWAWPGPQRILQRRLSLHGWLGRGGGERALSVALLALGVVLAVGLVGVFVASSLYGFSAHGSLRCGDGRAVCPPSFSLTQDVLAGQFAAMLLGYMAQSRWLRRVEATTYLLLRYRDWSWPSPLCYIRPIGMTPEAAAAALARFASAANTPFARRFFVGALVVIPYVVLLSASFALSSWLQLQWLPG